MRSAGRREMYMVQRSLIASLIQLTHTTQTILLLLVFKTRTYSLGNEAFSKKDFKTAIGFYSKAILQEPKNHIFFSNRRYVQYGIQPNARNSDHSQHNRNNTMRYIHSGNECILRHCLLTLTLTLYALFQSLHNFGKKTFRPIPCHRLYIIIILCLVCSSQNITCFLLCCGISCCVQCVSFGPAGMGKCRKGRQGMHSIEPRIYQGILPSRHGAA